MSVRNAQAHRFDPAAWQDFDRYSNRQSPWRRGGVPARQSQPVRESAAALSTQSQTSLTVVTAEGDRIAISLTARSKLAAASLSGPLGSSQSFTGAASSKAEVTVDGSLSEAELQDLGELIAALGQSTKQANQGGDLDVSALSESVAGLESLMAFNYNYSQTVQAGVLFRAMG